MTIYVNGKAEKVEPNHAPYAVGVELGNLYYGRGGKVTVNEKAGTIIMAYTTLEGENMHVKCKYHPVEKKAFSKTIKRSNMPIKGKVYPYWE